MNIINNMITIVQAHPGQGERFEISFSLLLN